MAVVTYRISEMRVVRVSGKVSQNNPDRIFTVYGKFFKGNDKNALSITSKNIMKEDISDPDFKLDPINGILVLNEKDKGRKKSISLSVDEIEETLKAIRGA